MPENQAILLGEVKGELKGLTEATKSNTAELKIFNEYMHTSKAIAAEREKAEARKHKKTMGISVSGGGVLGFIMAFVEKHI